MTFRYKKPLKSFTLVMEEKLKENQHKDHWKHESINWLLKRLLEEKTELDLALELGLPPKEIARECADVALFAMMIADNAGGL